MKEYTTVIIIPSLDPGQELIPYVKSLMEEGFEKIYLIDDGSDIYHQEIFEELKYYNQCTVLRHAINLGKGRALKDAFNHYLNTEDLDKYCGVITVDSDGQHTVEDVVRMSERMRSNKETRINELVLGARDFDLEHVPFKSRFGNRLTRVLFHLLHGVKLKDTQTGLRGIPNDMIPEFMELFGERFEYETNMLIAAARCNHTITEMPIKTVYEDGNSGTHFNPIRDSWAIYKLLFGTFFKYVIASLTSFILDIGVFRLAIGILKKSNVARYILIATVIARVISSIYNYLVNKKIVFKSSAGGLFSLIGYYLLVIIQMAASAGLVTAVFNYTQWSETLIKICVDTVLFLISFQIQKRIIFKN